MDFARLRAARHGAVAANSFQCIDAHLALVALIGPERHGVGHGLAVRGQAGVRLPGLEEAVRHGIQRRVRIVAPGRRRLVDGRQQAATLQPLVGRRFVVGGDGVQEMARQAGESGGMKASHDCQEPDLVRRHVGIRDAQDEGLVALVAGPVKQVCRLGVRSSHDDAGHAHDIELQSGGVQALDLLVARHEDLAALVPALLGARLLVLDVVAGHACLDEPADEVADVGITAVARIGVGDDQGREVHLGRCLPLVGRHPRAGEPLVAVGGQQGAHQSRRLVGHLAEGVAGEIGAGVLLRRALGRGGPAAEVDAVDPGSLHGDRLARRVGAERGDGATRREQLSQPGVELLGSDARDGIVDRDAPPLLHHLSGRVESHGLRKARARHPVRRGLDLVRKGHRLVIEVGLARALRRCRWLSDRHGASYSLA